MSEYQYYEFQAIDRPLSRQEMAEIRALSTRATITPTSFVNTYEWGNFKGDPIVLMKRYYDAFLYVANWGSHQLMLRLPRSVLPQETALRYAVEDEPFSVHITTEHLILAFDSETEEPEDWDEGEGWLATFVSLRAEIAAGDLRGLYMGWLLCVQERLLDDDAVEPPLPPGLGEPSASLQALAEFLRIEDDLLEAAAEDSPPTVRLTPSEEEARQWLCALPDAEKDDLLLRLAQDDAHVSAEVRRRIRESGIPAGVGGMDVRRRTVGELLAAADRRHREREQRQAQERERRQQEQAAARAAYLDSLAVRQEEIWRQVESLVATKRPSEYAVAIRLLTDLRDVAEREQQAKDFAARIMDLHVRHARKVSFVNRLNQAGLRSDWALPSVKQDR